MVRQARIDLPEHLYHVIGRGIEQRDIFVDHRDYTDFLNRLQEGLEETGSKCFAFSLLPNHFHLLVMRGHRPLAELMRRLMTGYAVRFNRRYQRVGHLFQNRYKAILCDRDSYFLELVAYIHLNPLRAGLVQDLKELREYKWCGHTAILGRNMHGFLAKEDVLTQFGNHLRSAMRKYESFISERVNRFERGELSGGGFSKRMSGVSPMDQQFLEKGETETSDQRILGDGDFVKGVLSKVEAGERPRVSVEEMIDQVERNSGVKFEEFMGKTRRRAVVQARAMYCYLAKERCGMSGAQLMKQLRLSSGAISNLFHRGRELYQEQILKL